MRKFILHILAFCTVLYCICIVCDYKLSKQLSVSRRRIWQSWHEVYTDTCYYDVVINGNSRALVQYDPTIIDSVLECNSYNLGMDGSPINRQMVKYNIYRTCHRKPEVLIQNIDIWTMGIRSGYEREQFFPYFILDRDLITEIDKYEHFSLLEKYVPLYRYSGYWETAKNDMILKTPELYKGYLGKDEHWDASVVKSNILVQRDPNMIRTFVEFLRKEKEDSVQVIFVYAPMFHDIFGHCDEIDLMYSMYDSIAGLFDIKVLDFMENTMSYDTCYFYNNMHLNKRGAELFTRQLTDSLRLVITKDNRLHE